MKARSVLTRLGCVPWMLAFASLSPTYGEAQEKGGDGTRVPLVIAVASSEELGGGQYRIMLGAAGGDGGDVLLVSAAHLNAVVVSEAVRSYLAARTRSLPPSASALVRISRSRAPGRPYPWMGQVVSKLRSSEPTMLPGVGRHRHVTIWLPAP